MAGLAFLAVTARMNVLQLMAIDAGVRQILVALADMACGAFDVFVGTFKRKLGFGMIKGFLFAPGLFGVA